MKSFKAICVGMVASAALAGGASAQTFSPNGGVTLTSDAPLDVQKGLTLSCDLTGSGTIAGGAHTVDGGSLDLSGSLGLCDLVGFTGTYDVSSTSLNSVTIEDVQVVGITGNCRGDLTGAFNQGNGKITFTGATIASDPPGGSPCIISGVVSTSPAVSFTIP